MVADTRFMSAFRLKKSFKREVDTHFLGICSLCMHSTSGEVERGKGKKKG